MIGQLVGKYRVIDRIGRGGMGTVYRAQDEMLHRDVAIKVLNAELNDPEVAKRFRAEAITVARLSHPGIATIYELFEHEGEWLMVMEFVRGETLESMATRMGPLSAQRSAELLMQALGALVHAHSMGVVHRDLKPANLMITENGSVKVMDFGIARVSGSEHLTNAGFMMGTPAYMAPEQVRGGEVDARADLYAMGVVFYRLTTGRLPFKGDTAFAMVQSQVNESPTPVRTVRHDLPVWVEEIVGRALAKPVEQRFQSAAEFHEALARCLAGLPLSSMYGTGDQTTMMTPSRPMPSGAYQSRPMPMPAPSASYPMTSTNPGGVEATVLSSGAGGVLAASTAPTMASPSGATQIPTMPVAGLGGTGTTAAPPKAPAPTVVKKPIPMAMIGGAAGVLILVVVGAIMMFSGGTPPVAPESTPAAAAPVEPAATPTTDATGTDPVVTPVAADPVTGTPLPTGTAGSAGSAGPTGSAGSAGSGGSTGSAGSAGSTGSAGSAGSTGSAGSAGSTGSASAAGTTAKPAAPPAGRAATTPAPTPTSTPTAPTSTPAAAAPAAGDPLATFADVKLFEVVGTRTEDKDAVLNFAGGQLSIMPRSGGTAMATLSYKRITRATYVRARDPKWDPALTSPPQGLSVGNAFRSAQHWLVLQGPDHYEVLQLRDANYRAILETLETRTGVKVERPAGEK